MQRVHARACVCVSAPSRDTRAASSTPLYRNCDTMACRSTASGTFWWLGFRHRTKWGVVARIVSISARSCVLRV